MADLIFAMISKPGAAVMATWFSNAAIGLHSDGYGKLLGEVTWTCSRVRLQLAFFTLSISHISHLVVCGMGCDVHER